MSLWQLPDNYKQGPNHFILSDVRAEMKMGETDVNSRKRAEEIYDRTMKDEDCVCPDLRFVTNLPEDSLPKLGSLTGFYNAAGLEATLKDIKGRVDTEANELYWTIKRFSDRL
jgi:hypothetical protein